MYRLSYKKNDNSDLVSNLLLLNSDMVYVIIYQDMSYEIRGLNDDSVWIISEGKGIDLKQIKQKIRKELEQLGIKFESEIRRTK